VTAAGAVGFSVSLALGSALLLDLVVFFGWETGPHPAEPPRFVGYSVRQGWRVDPIALLDQDLRRARLTWAVTVVHDRLVGELTVRHGLNPVDILSSTLPSPRRRDPVIDRACRIVVALEETYRLAYRAEDPLRTDLWSDWRRPTWRSSARRRFQEELSEVEELWPRLEAAA